MDDTLIDLLETILDDVSDLYLKADSLRNEIRELEREAQGMLDTAEDVAQGTEDVYVQTKPQAIVAEIRSRVEAMGA